MSSRKLSNPLRIAGLALLGPVMGHAAVIQVLGGGNQTKFESDTFIFSFVVKNLTDQPVVIHNILESAFVGVDKSDAPTGDAVLAGFSTCQPSIPGIQPDTTQLPSCTFTYTFETPDLDLGEPIDIGKTDYTLTVVAQDLMGNTLGTAATTFSITVEDFPESGKPPGGVPEPATFSVVLSGGFAIALQSRRSRNASERSS